MGLQSLQYCAFLVVVAAVYLHLPVRMQPVFLLGASWVFYALAMPAMLPVTIALAVFTYLCGRGLAWRGGAHKTAFLRLGVIGMLGILAFSCFWSIRELFEQEQRVKKGWFPKNEKRKKP